jgi:putative glutamine amidotransferase
MKPIIGITMDWEGGTYRVNDSYVQAVLNAGGIPICLPYIAEEDGEQLINKIDGLLLTGGGDINPILFGEEPLPKLGRVVTKRDEREIQWTKIALQRNIPILAICRGLQVLNVALGGTIIQDIYSQNEREILLHTQNSHRSETSHFVHLQDKCKLQQVVSSTKIAVNSFHHQAVKEIAEDLTIVGVASDGIVEAVEHKTSPFCIGVQWHPEELAFNGEEGAIKLFKAFVAACTKE